MVSIEIREMLSTGVLNVTYALAVVNRIIRQEVLQRILEVNCLVNLFPKTASCREDYMIVKQPNFY